MPILNYTTKIDADKTVGEIQQILAKHGANAIMNQYDSQGYITSLSFKMTINEKEIAFRLPTDWRPILSILNKDPKVPAKLKTNEQALKVSWRIVKVWIEAQMAIIETKMVKMEQVFLPYAVTKSGETMSEKFINDPKFLLGNGE
jgi:hypothetical protein